MGLTGKCCSVGVASQINSTRSMGSTMVPLYGLSRYGGREGPTTPARSPIPPRYCTRWCGSIVRGPQHQGPSQTVAPYSSPGVDAIDWRSKPSSLLGFIRCDFPSTSLTQYKKKVSKKTTPRTSKPRQAAAGPRASRSAARPTSSSGGGCSAWPQSWAAQSTPRSAFF